MAGKSSRTYIPLYDTQPLPVKLASEEESIWYFPDFRDSENDQNTPPPPKPEQQRRGMSSQAVGALKNNKPSNIGYPGSSKKVEAFCVSLPQKSSAHIRDIA